MLAGPSNINALWTGAGGPCESNNDGDPDVRYDPLADRWVIHQFVAFTDFCVAVSRKSFIGAVADAPDPSTRLPGSLAAAAIAVMGGAHAIRAHDVAETVQAVRVAQALRQARDEG